MNFTSATESTVAVSAEATLASPKRATRVRMVFFIAVILVLTISIEKSYPCLATLVPTFKKWEIK